MVSLNLSTMSNTKYLYHYRIVGYSYNRHRICSLPSKPINFNEILCEFITFTNSQLGRKGRIIYCLLMHKTDDVAPLEKGNSNTKF